MCMHTLCSFLYSSYYVFIFLCISHWFMLYRGGCFIYSFFVFACWFCSLAWVVWGGDCINVVSYFKSWCGWLVGIGVWFEGGVDVLRCGVYGVGIGVECLIWGCIGVVCVLRCIGCPHLNCTTVVLLCGGCLIWSSPSIWYRLMLTDLYVLSSYPYAYALILGYCYAYTPLYFLFISWL